MLINSTEAMVASKHLHARVVVYEDHKNLIAAVQNGEVVAVLLDRYVASYFIKEQNIKNLIIEREINVEMKVRMFLHYNATALKCEEDEYEDEWYVDEIQSILYNIIPASKIQNTKVRSLTEMFDGTDDGIMKVTTLIASFIVVLAFLYEFVVHLMRFTKREEQPLGNT